jgi:hypothetical protein
MAVADFWSFIPSPRDEGSANANHQISPGITNSPSRLSLSDLRRNALVQVLGFASIGVLARCVASIRWLFVRAALCLQLPPDSTSRWTPLPFS